MAGKSFLPLFVLLACLSLLSACVGIPEGIKPVSGFDINRYTGKWYEIARLDHRFERGLSHVSANYALANDGSVAVVNKGYDAKAGQWKEIRGRACFVESNTVGRLKVSFFGPFFGGYNVIALDKEHYQYALVCGPSRSYLWILARSTTLPESIRRDLLTSAKNMGFDTSRIIFVAHDRPGSGL